MKTRTAVPAIFAVALTGALLLAPVAGAAAPRPAVIYASIVDFGQGQSFTLSGTVKSVDYAENVIVIRTRGDIQTVRITPTTSIEISGQAGSIADLRPGVHVRVRGSIISGELTADSIDVKNSK